MTTSMTLSNVNMFSQKVGLTLNCTLFYNFFPQSTTLPFYFQLPSTHRELAPKSQISMAIQLKKSSLVFCTLYLSYSIYPTLISSKINFILFMSMPYLMTQIILETWMPKKWLLLPLTKVWVSWGFSTPLLSRGVIR